MARIGKSDISSAVSAGTADGSRDGRKGPTLEEIVHPRKGNPAAEINRHPTGGVYEWNSSSGCYTIISSWEIRTVKDKDVMASPM